MLVVSRLVDGGGDDDFAAMMQIPYFLYDRVKKW